jgi:type IV pilus assembly protein PilB
MTASAAPRRHSPGMPGDLVGWNGHREASRPDLVRRPIEEIAAALGFVDSERARAAAGEGHANGGASSTTGRMLTTGLLTEEQLAIATAEHHALDYLDLTVYRVDVGAAGLIPSQVARQHGAIPVGFHDGALLVAVSDPANVLAIDDIAMLTGLEIRRAVATPDEIAATIANVERRDVIVKPADDETQLDAPWASEERAPVSRLVNSIIADAVERGASDIHFDPEDAEMRVRFRVDGIVCDAYSVPRRTGTRLVSRLKIMSNLDIAEIRRPQDGRFGLRVDGRQIDVRTVALPVVRGEALVMRILDDRGQRLELEQLGMSAEDREKLTRALSRNQGAVIVAGPTGSGKTTTLYAAVDTVGTDQRTLATIEDPVEHRIEGAKQVQVDPRKDLTFASGLRSMLRGDPDVLMVGEIRDRETARMAVGASLAGHLVLSSIHAGDAAGTITRLRDAQLEPYLLASALTCIVAQRLVRTLCPSCRRETVISRSTLRAHGFRASRNLKAWEPVGCRRCGGNGYRQRTGIFEVMPLDDGIRSRIMDAVPAHLLGQTAIEHGLRPMREDGLAKVREGVTSFPELIRAIGSGVWQGG